MADDDRKGDAAPPMTVAFIGCGNMATAIVQGLLNSKALPPAHIRVSHPRASTAPHVVKLVEQGVVAFVSNVEAAKTADVVVLCVKPNMVQLVLRDISTSVTHQPLYVSVAAGVGLATLGAAAVEGSRIVWAMPNTPSAVGVAATAFAPNTACTSTDKAAVRSIFGAIGICEEVLEDHMDAVIGVSGSGPAYIYLIIEAMADGGVRAGLKRDVAMRLAAQTVAGAAQMVLQTGKHPGQLKDEVCSPGGTTIEAIRTLETGGLRGLMTNATLASAGRARKLRGGPEL